MYLNDWIYWDEQFSNGIKSKSRKMGLKSIQEAAKYYKISRNFKIIKSEERLSYALEQLKLVKGPVTKFNFCKKVTDLSNIYKKKYKQNTISASSKFMWLRFRSPVLIYDSRAVRYLKNNNYLSGNVNYEKFSAAWLSAYGDYSNEINRICKDLHKSKEYTRAHEYSDKEVKLITATDWFKERVFDKYLWFNAES